MSSPEEVEHTAAVMREIDIRVVRNDITDTLKKLATVDADLVKLSKRRDNLTRHLGASELRLRILTGKEKP